MRHRHDTKRTPRLLYRLIVAAALSWLVGCDPGGAGAPFEIHLGKLNAALSVTGPFDLYTSVPLPPEAFELKLNAYSLDEGVVDFLDLRGCALQSTMIKQNSNLGRKAKPSQRLMLELEYLQLAPACISRLREHNNTALAETLEQRRQLQRKQLPSLIFNATLGGEEYRAFWRPAPAPGQYPSVEPSVALSALEAINRHVRRWLSGDYRAQQREFELLLSEVAGGNGGTLLEQEQAHHYREMHTAITILEAQLAPNLPSQYRSWKAQRSETLARIGRAQQHPLKNLKRVGEHSTAD